MFDNLNSLLMGIFKQSRQKQETYSSRMQEIEAVSLLMLLLHFVKFIY